MELPPEDQPPREIWHHSERIKEWFESVKQRRTDRAKGLTPIEDEDADDMEQNQIARELREELS